ncbi:cob(I)yrinic acid a,c-diamide adenosyltransferase [Parageobacillus thermoglucosidasius]|uniref:cob(I)yrinic acid a,c-diamide adenosyltransferase n=1 Tax=Parageobacillus thermoglucosidasius TaxID=1426 RepID=UPI000E1A29AD|nr:cob(I)yrinic acid a,c-diamide adenosyltransferase [Parageobacillus thermoglucosidasius]RDE32767.1 cob(I)yrinic acid a,c-diamide adenosyltransferase [Parageobacillus thermoglucosidasius]
MRLPPHKTKGRVIVYMGDGKGKTTAALGLAIRAAGRGKKAAVIQFIKSPERTYGEQLILQKLGIEMYPMGAGFTWTKTPEAHRRALKAAWELTQEKVLSGMYDLMILDELNNALAIDRFPVDDIISVQKVLQLIEKRPPALHLVITGRFAKREIIEAADIVTEMKLVKHDYEQGVTAMEGIEF